MVGADDEVAGGERGAGPGRRRRRGRPERAAGEAQVAQELRRRRQALRLTVRQAADRAGVSPGMVSEIETGKRVPSVPTWAKLRSALGIDAPLALLTRAHPPTEVRDTHLTRLAACILASGGRALLSDLGVVLGISTAAVREQLPLVAPRLVACGFELATDGLEVHLQELEVAKAPLQALGQVAGERRRRALGEDALLVLVYVGWHGEVTRKQIERFRAEDSETLLARLVDGDLLAAVRDDSLTGRPNRYRLTVSGHRALGAASPEELREKLRPSLGALVDGDGADAAPPLPDQLAVLALVAGLGEADQDLVERGLGKDCGALLIRMVQRDLLIAVEGASGTVYRPGPVASAVTGSESVEALAVAIAGERPALAAPVSPGHRAVMEGSGSPARGGAAS
jgi:chromosome segregation and condensation protein ScpB/DNA-binding XRE family transcriptional regulator